MELGLWRRGVSKKVDCVGSAWVSRKRCGMKGGFRGVEAVCAEFVRSFIFIFFFTVMDCRGVIWRAWLVSGINEEGFVKHQILLRTTTKFKQLAHYVDKKCSFSQTFQSSY